MTPQNDLSRRARLALLLVAFVAWFGVLDYRQLAKPDEGRYAEIPREMAVSGDWLTPRLNGIKYLEKPPLQYWITAAAFETFGFHPWTARLWTAVAGFFTVVMVWWGGRKFFGAAAGDYAALVLISNLLFVAMGQINTLDMTLTLFTTLALVGFCVAQRDGATLQEQKLGMLVAWIAMAFAVLSKGLVGVVLPGATLVLHSVIARDWALWRRLYLVPGALLFLAIAVPWFVAVSVVNPEFPWFFFIQEHVLRYATDEAGRPGSGYYFAVILLVGMLPWSVIMLDAVWATLKRRSHDNGQLDRPALILLIWAILTFVFFSLSRSKLPPYILPIFPALALLMGKRLAGLDARALTARLLPVGAAMLAAFFVIAKAADYVRDPISRALYQRYEYWLYAAAAAVLLGVIYSIYQAARGRKPSAVAGFAVAGFIASLLTLLGHNSFASLHSSYDMAQKIRPLLAPDVPFYSVGTYDQTLPFYLRRTVTLVQFRGELDFGLKQEPQRAIDSLEAFRRRWDADKRAFALMTPENYATLRRDRLPMDVLVDDGRRIVVKKPEVAP